MNFAYAGLWLRICSFALDYLIIAAYLLLLVGLGLAVNVAWPALSQRLFGNPLSGQLLSFLLVTLPVSLYFALSEASAAQATWGKRQMGIQLIGTDSRRLSLGRALGRTLLKFIPWELSHTLIWQVRFAPATAAPLINAGFVLVWLLVIANLASLVWRRNHQALYDWLAGSYVIRR